MQKIGITGQSGFIGSYTKKYIQLVDSRGLKIVEFKDNYFKSKNKLQSFVDSCDVIVHLAGMNRGEDKEVYETNIELTNKLLSALDAARSKPHVIFASSTQETNRTAYGRSKLESRLMLESWAKKNHAKFNGLIIPNVFGPFSKPFANMVTATFCHQIIVGQKPKIITDKKIDVIYIENLVKKIVGVIRSENSAKKIIISPDHTIKVSKLLEKLETFDELYRKQHIIPLLIDEFERDLFKTYCSFFVEPEI